MLAVKRALLHAARYALKRGRLTYALVVVLSVILCAQGALRHSEVNRKYKDKDQGAYLELAARIAESRTIQVDGARPPLYPAIVALAWRSDLSIEEFFERAKKISIVATLSGWFVLLFVLRRRLRPLTALTVWWALGFTVFMFYAPYIKGEGLFYFFATWSFLCLLDELWRPRWWSAVGAGMVAAAAQLCKESIVPSLGLFVGVQLLVIAVRAVGLLGRAPAGLRFRGKLATLRPLLRRAVSVPLVLLSFMVVVYPYARVNERVFGHHFYNVNSYFYIWYDSWGQVVRGTRKYRDRRAWPEMPPEKLPSAKKYWQTHSLPQIHARIQRGATGILDNSIKSHGFFDYSSLALLATALTLGSNSRIRRWLASNWHVTLFVACYFAGYFLMCTWFFAIHPGVRFIVTLVGPLLCIGAWLSDRNRTNSRFGSLGLWTLIAGASLLIDMPILATYVVESFKGAGW